MTKKRRVVPASTTQTKETLKKSMSTIGHKSFSQKHKTITWHKLKTVRTRACALQESFYPDTEVPYAAVKKRMATLLGIVDRASILAYLGRPPHKTMQKIGHTKKYDTGKVVPITHYLRRNLEGKVGYIDVFGLGTVYSKKGVWFIHWSHEGLVNEVFQKKVTNGVSKSPPAPPSTERDEGLGKVSINNFSLSKGTSNNNKNSTLKDRSELTLARHVMDSRDREKRESSYNEREICTNDCILNRQKQSSEVKVNTLEKSILHTRISPRHGEVSEEAGSDG